MSRFWETVTCAFHSSRTVPATGRKCLPGANSPSVHPRPLIRVRHVTFWSGPRDFGQKRQTFLRRMPLLAPKVCPRTSQRHWYISLTHVGTSVYYSLGSRRFNIAYNKALTLVQKTTSGSNTLLEILLSWATVTDGPSDDALPDVVTLDHLSEVKCAWEKARDFVHVALATLTGEPTQQVHTRSGFKRWMKSLVRFS